MKKFITFILTFVFAIALGGCNMQSDSIGIIGGADGPTAVFVSSNINWLGIFGIVGLIVVAVLITLFICRKRKNK